MEHNVVKFKGEKAKAEMKWKKDTINIHLEGQEKEVWCTSEE